MLPLSFVRSGRLRQDGLAYGLLTLLCLALYLPGLTTIPPVDRDEPRFAQATKQMVDTGDFVRPHFQTADRFNKPIGIYWLQAAAVSITQQQGRPAIWAYRLPSILGACTAVLLTYWIGAQLFHRRGALLGAAFLASSALMVVEAHLATTDAVLLACAVAAQGCLGALYLAAHRTGPARRRYAVGFWLAQGLGILVKGPIVPLVSSLTVGGLALSDRRALSRTLAGLHARWGFPLMGALILPWMIAAGLSTDWRFYHEWIGGDLLPKIVGGHETHGAPPGLYLLLLIATFWPGSFAAGLGIVRGVAHRDQGAERFCLAWLIPTWLFFEVMPTKLPHYVLPVYPALALLVAVAVFDPPVDLSRTWSSLLRSGFVLWSLVTLAAGVVITAGAIRLGDGVDLTVLCAVLAACLSCVICARLCWTGQLIGASWVAVIGSVVLFVPALQWVLPDLRALWLSNGAAAAIARRPSRGSGSRPLAAVGYHEPSLIFLAGTNMALIEPQPAVVFLRQQSGGLVLVSDDQQATFERAAGELGVSIHEVWSSDGFNYSMGQWTRLRLFEQQPRSDP
jgi:4-amino-4-deoxy-L-arabinose transferase-like glycosyltransferase